MDEVDEKVLRFEGVWWQYAGSKEQAIRDHLGLSAVDYYQRVNRLLDDPVALVAAPQVVSRLRRIRERQTARRTGRQIA